MTHDSPPHLKVSCRLCWAGAGESCDEGLFCPCPSRYWTLALNAQSGEKLLEEIRWQCGGIQGEAHESAISWPAFLGLWGYNSDLLAFGPLDRRWISGSELRPIRDLLLDRANNSSGPSAWHLQALADEFDPDGLRRPSIGMSCRNPAWLDCLRADYGDNWTGVPSSLMAICPWGDADLHPAVSIEARALFDHGPWEPWPLQRLKFGWPTPDHVIEELLDAGPLGAEHRAVLADHVDRILPEQEVLEIEADALAG